MTQRHLMIDISSNNPIPNLRKHYKAGHRVIAIKATESSSYTWAEHARLADQWHKLGGAVWHYHFARPGNAANQADYFLRAVHRHFKAGDRIVLDAEVTGVTASFVRDFIGRCQQRVPLWPGIVYSYASFLTRAKIKPSPGWGLWLAAYGTVQPKPVAGWSALTAWQYTDRSRVAGETGTVDESRLLDPRVIPAEKERPVKKLAHYNKTIAAALVGIGSWCGTALADGTVTTAEWGQLAGILAAASGVYAVKNRQKKS